MTVADLLLQQIFSENRKLMTLKERDFRDYLADPDQRIDYAFKRLSYCLGVKAYLPTRAFYGAGQLIGTRQASPISGLRRAFEHGDRDWIKERMPDRPPGRGTGHIYFASRYSLNDEIKIGFTTDLWKRESGLANAYCASYLRWYPGTYLDEHVFHCANARSRTTGEWFARPVNVYPEVYIALEGAREERVRFEAYRALRRAA